MHLPYTSIQSAHPQVILIPCSVQALSGMQYMKFLSRLRVVSLHPTSIQEEYQLLAIHSCLFTTFVPKFHKWGLSLVSSTQGHTIPWQHGTHSKSCTHKLTSCKVFPEQPTVFSCSKNPLQSLKPRISFSGDNHWLFFIQ